MKIKIHLQNYPTRCKVTLKYNPFFNHSIEIKDNMAFCQYPAFLVYILHLGP